MAKNTRQMLLDAAVAVFSKNPSAPIIEIAEAANVGRATLYRHFPSRDALIRELTIESYRITNKVLEPVFELKVSASDLLLEMLKAIIPLGDKYFFLLMEKDFGDDPEIQALNSKDEQSWNEVFEYFTAEGLIASDIPIAWFTTAVEALIYSAWGAAHDGRIAANDAAALVHRTLISGLGNPS